MSTLPSSDFVANALQDTGDFKIALLRGPMNETAIDAVTVLLQAAKAIGLRNEQILLTVVANEARLQVLPFAPRRES